MTIALRHGCGQGAYLRPNARVYHDRTGGTGSDTVRAIGLGAITRPVHGRSGKSAPLSQMTCNDSVAQMLCDPWLH